MTEWVPAQQKTSGDSPLLTALTASVRWRVLVEFTVLLIVGITFINWIV